MADFSRITVDPDHKRGQPCIRGMGITVRDVLDMVAFGGPWSEILDDYPYLERADIEAAVAYAAAHLPNFIPATTPLLITRRLLNVDDIVSWANRVGFSPLRPLHELHATLVYSRYDIDVEELTLGPSEVRVDASGDRRLEAFRDNAIVLTFESPRLENRSRQAWKSSGWKTEFPAQLHVTLAYGDHPRLLTLEPYFGELIFGPEVLKALPPLEGAETV
ncbi:DUF433 domain-containing protein [Brevundimonas goettingensis]|uniref:Anti-CBASS protein Acb1 n=1 Tax=Brevundimonas goettingensis TaxID=2774190 RepID=A0A975C7Z9_9CAUL|nr:DUF433 domain-containing protein [Brevundimonas goettingensis]QTC92856.1 DUF433 domain-containing protein [Brevundimonas goettingensis]